MNVFFFVFFLGDVAAGHVRTKQPFKISGRLHLTVIFCSHLIQLTWDSRVPIFAKTDSDSNGIKNEK